MGFCHVGDEIWAFPVTCIIVIETLVTFVQFTCMCIPNLALNYYLA